MGDVSDKVEGCFVLSGEVQELDGIQLVHDVTDVQTVKLH